jgi:5-formyltetrahydrofolate cyclo-ligase
MTGKQELREHVWRLLEVRRAARFPGTKGRIPNFVGAERAAARLAALPAWRRARAIKANPDAPQLPVRRLALEQGKTVYMAVPRLRTIECFVVLEPARLGSHLGRAATIRGADRLGRPVRVEEVEPLDLIVCGSVAVNEAGARVGKGGGYSDLEFGLLRERGAVSARTPIVTTVHPLQVVAQAIEMLPHDLPLDWIVTPDGPRRCRGRFPRPEGIYWRFLPPEKIAAVPALARLRAAPGR